MFRKNEVSVLGWIILILILTVPVLNVVFVVWVLMTHKAGTTVKNFFVAYLIFWLFAVFGMFNGAFAGIQGLFG